jgi:hypothetical protein
MSIDTCLLSDRDTTLEVIKAVEEEAWNRHSTLTRSDVANVFIDDIEEHYGERTWYVSASIYTGNDLLGDPDLYSAYKCDNGEWIVEWDSCKKGASCESHYVRG